LPCPRAALHEILERVEQEEQPRRSRHLDGSRLNSRSVEARVSRLGSSERDDSSAKRRTAPVDDPDRHGRVFGREHGRLVGAGQGGGERHDDDLLGALLGEPGVGAREVGG